MSPSSDNHAERSNTSSPSDAQPPHHASDALPMITTSLFDSTITACGQDFLPSLFYDPTTCTVPQLATGHWPKTASPLGRPPSTERLAALRASENMAPSAPVMSSFTGNLAVPVQVYGGAGSSFDQSPAPSLQSNGRNHPGAFSEHSSTYTAFVLTCSRIVKVRKHPNATFLSLRSAFDLLNETNQPDHRSGESLSVWTLKDLSTPDEVWVVFKSHHDACAFLELSLPSFSTSPALEADLEPFEKLHRIDLSSRFPPLPVIRPEGKSHRLRMSISAPDFHNRIYTGHLATGIQTSRTTQTDKFVISSNPPNPRTTFRVGDWICNSVTCAAHNFGRNLACRGCGCPRSESQASSMNRQALGMSSARLPTSPRFASTTVNALYTSSPIPNPSNYPSVQHAPRYPLAPQSVTGPKPASPSHPLLTPSGRSFAVGGKVQNISSDPSVPCIMYWPDNEPSPDQGQIRPGSLAGIPQPPILNTGNRGPIEHQPGDWICKKCNYLNWRRRKVCQTCYPYAEGNGDSISAAVQSERINLLTSLLAQNQLPLRAASSPVDTHHRNTVAQVHHQPSPTAATPSAKPTRSRIDSTTAAQYPDSQFIYETSAAHRSALPAFPNMRELEDTLPVPVGAPVPLLPSFLQDIVRSPTLSPTSTSSADLSVEEYEDISPSPCPNRDQVVARDDSGVSYSLGNIWRLNDEETASMAGIALPHHEDLVASRKSSQEFLRRQSP